MDQCVIVGPRPNLRCKNGISDLMTEADQRLLRQIRASLLKDKTLGLHRTRHVNPHDKQHLNFSSNDYLSLTSDLRLKNAWMKGCELYPVGSGGSPLSSGYSSAHRNLEKAFSEALAVDDSLYFSSGYAANLSLMAFVARLKALAYIDKAMHASVYDGLALFSARFKRYLHCDLNDLGKKFLPGEASLIITESVFSMSGQIAPLVALSQYPSSLLVDEAHAFGVMGPEGLGLIPELNLSQFHVPLRVIPLGKAYAGMGAIIAGQGDWIELLLQSARPYIYSTSPSPAAAYALLKTLDVIREADDRRSKLAQLIAYFRAAITRSELTWRDSKTAIQQLQLGCPHKAQVMAAKLAEKSICCFPMRQPTVSKQETGLRVILNYHHQPEDIDYLFASLHS
jgi:8-amino-7-oxononanoate synthase